MDSLVRPQNNGHQNAKIPLNMESAYLNDKVLELLIGGRGIR